MVSLADWSTHSRLALKPVVNWLHSCQNHHSLVRWQTAFGSDNLIVRILSGSILKNKTECVDQPPSENTIQGPRCTTFYFLSLFSLHTYPVIYSIIWLRFWDWHLNGAFFPWLVPLLHEKGKRETMDMIWRWQEYEGRTWDKVEGLH